MTITAAQIRGARGVLNWTQGDLADRTGISATSIGSIESGATQPRESTLAIIQKSFEDAGIEFLPGGIRKRDEMILILEGEKVLDSLLDDIYKTLLGTGGEVLIFGLEERANPQTEEYEKVRSHLDRLTKEKITERIILKKGDRNFMAPKEYYKWIAPEYFSPNPFLIYGNKVAMINWGEPMKVFIIDSNYFSSTFEKVFNFVWERAEAVS